MIERLTNEVRQIIALALDEAARQARTVVGTEHLLLGVSRDGASTPAKIMTSVGVTLERLRTQVEGTVGRANEDHRGPPGFAPSARRALEVALRCAQDLDSDIAAEQLMMGVLNRSEDNLALEVLVEMGINVGQLRYVVLSTLPEWTVRFNMADVAH